MNRLFDSFFGRPLRAGLAEPVWVPVVDMYETKDDLVITAELPGVREKEIQLSITGDLLTLKGERAQTREVKQENSHRVERYFGKFERHILLPVPIEASRVKATYRDGVLEVRLPKTEDVKPKEIKID
jgi:HSP20 family protein